MSLSIIRRLLSTVLLAITSVVIISALAESWHTLQAEKAFNLTYFLFISIIHFTFLIISARRLHLVVNAFSRSHIKFLQWFKVFIYGRALNKVFPQLGHLYKGFTLKKTTSFPYQHYAASNLFYTWFDTIFNIIIAVALILIFSESTPFLTKIINSLILILVAISFIPLIGASVRQSGFRTSRNRIIRKSIQLNDLIHQSVSAELTKDLIILGIISSALFVARIYLAFHIFGNTLTIGDIAVIFSLLKITNTVTITPGNIGIQELSIGFLSQLLGYGMATGISVMLTLRMYEYLMYIFIWVSYTIRMKIGKVVKY